MITLATMRIRLEEAGGRRSCGRPCFQSVVISWVMDDVPLAYSAGRGDAKNLKNLEHLVEEKE